MTTTERPALRLTAVHQFVRVGDGAFLGGCSAIMGDVIPFGIAVGNRAKLRGLNLVGLRRAGMSRDAINDLRAVYRAIFDPSRPLAANVETVRARGQLSPNAQRMLDFVLDRGKRYLTVPPLGGAEGDDDD